MFMLETLSCELVASLVVLLLPPNWPYGLRPCTTGSSPSASIVELPLRVKMLLSVLARLRPCAGRAGKSLTDAEDADWVNRCPALTDDGLLDGGERSAADGLGGDGMISTAFASGLEYG